MKKIYQGKKIKSSENGPAFKITMVKRKLFHIHKRVSFLMSFISPYPLPSHLQSVFGHKMGTLLAHCFSLTEKV